MAIPAANQSGRLTTNKMYEARYGDQWMFEVAEKYVGFCKQRGMRFGPDASARRRPPGACSSRPTRIRPTSERR